MSDLEQSIANWCKQMLAAGIKSPVPLEELEIHLREEIERQIKSGKNEQYAFENAIKKMGHPKNLKTEFTKIPAVWRILAALWFAGCLLSLVTMSRQIISEHFSARPQLLLASSFTATLIYVAGVFGSFLLFRGSKYGIKIIRTIALFFFIICAAQSLANSNESFWRIWCGVWAIFSVVTIWQLHSRKNLKSVA
jgi:hypothetical protein